MFMMKTGDLLIDTFNGKVLRKTNRRNPPADLANLQLHAYPTVNAIMVHNLIEKGGRVCPSDDLHETSIENSKPTVANTMLDKRAVL